MNEQKAIILGIIASFFEQDDNTVILEFVGHVGFDLRAVNDTACFADAWLGHYRVRQGQYDVNRAINDLATWPPIAARIAELRAERDGV